MPEERIYRLTETQMRQALAPTEEKLQAQRLEILALRSELESLRIAQTAVTPRPNKFDVRQGLLAQIVLGKPLSLQDEPPR
jgi:hypothetical protein